MKVSCEGERAAELLALHQSSIYSRTDRLFAHLLLFEWLWSILFAALITPRTWAGAASEPHVHLLAAVILGGLISIFPVIMVHFHPGERQTRYGIACAQMLMSALLIHTSGGRIETHFHIFGSLAFLGFYRDWKVFIPATIVTALDHWLRGWLYPMSIFGVPDPVWWRWLEHAAWVLFCDFFLIQSALQSQVEMAHIAHQQASLEATNTLVEQEVSRATTQLVAEKERFRMAFENAPIGMALIDDAGHVLRANDVLCDILGYPHEELVKLDIQSLVDEEEEEAQAGVSEKRFRRKDGEWAWIDYRLSRCPDFSVAQMVDLSERKKTEEALRQAQKLESVGLLAGGIAHEINTPIQYIGDNLRFLEESFQELEPLLEESSLKSSDSDYLRDEIPQAIRHSLEGVNRVAGIVRSMKEYSHAGQRELTPTNLNHLIDSSVIISRSEWKYVAELETDFQKDLPLVACDPGEIGQVILNMIVNAGHAIQDQVADSQERGLIQVTTRAKNNGVEIRISDSGSGIPEELKAKIFEPFFTTKQIGKGTGQGLAIAQAAVLRHNGRIEVESERGRGTTFTIFLPGALAQVG
ncbi:MAG: PAS domain S-box protein [Candidatus Eremiobacteraeota bacterium]|nr:PAS domain S-box protein [Candidatus Eremiobacteraeota bacterium]